MFDDFIESLSWEINKELPGFSAQKKMSPLGEENYSGYIRDALSPQKSAVLILFYPALKTKIPRAVLIERAKNEGSNHAGQISFPGGSYDKADKFLSVTALREAEEEIGINKESVFLIGELTTLYIPVSNFIVHPFVGFCKTTPQFSKDAKEVEEILEVEVNEFLIDRNKSFTQRHVRSKNRNIKVPCYKIGEKIIWGATAMIISELEEIIKRAK